MSSRDQIRASDADRERVAEHLRDAAGEGRLTLDEVDQRLRGVWAAKTFADLDQFLADLPSSAPAASSQLAPAAPGPGVPAAKRVPAPPSRHEENPKLPTWLSLLWRLWFVAVAVNLVVWLLVVVSTGSLVYPWPLWVAGPWGAVNLALTVLFPPRHRSG
jgi:hypothetical protein